MISLRFSSTLGAALVALLVALLWLLLPARAVQAGPPAPGEIILTQPDGTTFAARLWGDEWQNGLETVDGYSILADGPSGYWVYAQAQPGGELAAAQAQGRLLRVGVDDPSGLEKRARPPRSGPAQAPLLQNESAPAAMSGFSGSQKLLVLLVSFNDTAPTYPAEHFRKLAFGSSGSIVDFYRKASGSKLSYQPAAESFSAGGAANDGVVGWLNLGYPHPNGLNEDISRDVARAALSKANPYVDYASFDANKDGYVTNDELQVLIITAGCEGSLGPNCPAGVPRLWAHAYNLDLKPLRLDEKYLGQTSSSPAYRPGGYAIAGERHFIVDGSGCSLAYPATLGPIVHELGHLLAWPDLYDVSYWTEGIGAWSLMSGGSWNSAAGGRPGSSPALPDAFLKWYQSWIAPVQAPAAALVAPHAGQTYLLGSNPNGVDWVFERRSGSGEYWLLEYRQRAGYDAGLPGSGLLLWHIDEAAGYMNQLANNSLQNPGHRLVALEQADGRDDLFRAINRGDSGDPYPGLGFQLAWGPGTKPSSAYNDNTPSELSLRVDTVVSKALLPLTVVTADVTGRLSAGGAPAAGQRVELWYSTNGGASSNLYAFATTNASGNFSLPRPPLGAPGQLYRLYWQNPSAPSAYQGWLSDFLGWSTGGQAERHHHEINIADVTLRLPPAGAAVSSPVTYEWQPRPSACDSYRVVVANENFASQTTSDAVSNTNRATLPAPSWVALYQRHFWYLLVETAAGQGSSYWMRPLTFLSKASSGWTDPPVAGAPRLTPPHPQE